MGAKLIPFRWCLVSRAGPAPPAATRESTPVVSKAVALRPKVASVESERDRRKESRGSGGRGEGDPEEGDPEGGEAEEGEAEEGDPEEGEAEEGEAEEARTKSPQTKVAQTPRAGLFLNDRRTAGLQNRSRLTPSLRSLSHSASSTQRQRANRECPR
jgi:hypothetical protein